MIVTVFHRHLVNDRIVTSFSCLAFHSIAQVTKDNHPVLFHDDLILSEDQVCHLRTPALKVCRHISSDYPTWE